MGNMDLETGIKKPDPVWISVGKSKFRILNGKLFANGKELKVLGNEILRSVESDGYTSNFSLQWNKFSQIQIDQFHEGEKLSLNRVKEVTLWKFDDLEGQNILEVGCGAGRFTKVFLENTRANLFSFDYSESVVANYRNNERGNGSFYLFQADIYDLPFENGQFDKIFCFGVLQFTPAPEKAVFKLAEMLKPGGEIVIDFFPIKGWYTKIHAKYILRPITRRMEMDRLLRIVERNIDWMMRMYDFFESMGIGRLLNRFIPICDMDTTFPKGLSQAKRREWAILDTFNMFSPRYDKPQKMVNVRKYVSRSGLEIIFSGFVEYSPKNKLAVVRAKKPEKVA